MLCAVVLLLSRNSYAQSHESINESRSRYGNNVFFNHSIVSYVGTITRSGDESIFGEVDQEISGYGLKTGFGIETFNFVQLSLAHTLINHEAKETSLDHFSGSELTGDVTLKFDSPIGNLGFGLSLYGTQVSMQNTEKTSKFLGDGKVRHINWNYYITHGFSLNLKYESTEGIYRSQSGDTGIDKFELDRRGVEAGFSFWF